MKDQIPLHLDFILTDIQCASKGDVLRILAENAVKSRALKQFSPEQLAEKLEQREAMGSTGFGEGVAIPHCAIEGLEDFVLGMMVIPLGIDFTAIDGQPVRLIFLIIGPSEKRNRHIKFLSAISQMIKTPGITEKLMEAKAPENIETLLKEHLTIREEKSDTAGCCLLNVYIQKEDVFSDVLELLSSEAEGSLTVIETQNAGEYLNRLPLFSSYWTEGSSTFNRLIQAVVPKSHCNNLIRRINLIEDTFSVDSGVLITAQELLYSSGSIDF